jgi:hypothetical protein
MPWNIFENLAKYGRWDKRGGRRGRLEGLQVHRGEGREVSEFNHEIFLNP